MKSFFIVAAMLVTATIIFSPASTVSATTYGKSYPPAITDDSEWYPLNLYGNSNYVCIYGHQMYGQYLDVSSIYVIDSERGHEHWVQIIALADMNDDGKIVQTYQQEFFVNGWKVYSVSKDKSVEEVDLDEQVGYMQSTINGFNTGYYYAFGKVFVAKI